VADRDQERFNHRLSWIAFILMALAGLLAIIYNRPVPAQERTESAFQRSI
jgi:hypothetical protein